MKKIACCNLGCSKNIIDGENILGTMGEMGFCTTQDFHDADIILVNTCTFIQEATQEAIETILELAQHKIDGKCSTLIVSGCFSERYRKSIAKNFPEVDLWTGVATWQKELAAYFNKTTINAKRDLQSQSITQYIKISEGCSHHCSFCIIPSIRGAFKSRPPQDIIKEAQWLYKQGARELIVVSQDTSFYGRDIGTTLTDLLKSLLDKTAFHWIRTMYLHPKFIDIEFIKLIGTNKRLCSYFDIPIQHIADPILSSMHRKQNSKEIYKQISNIRKFAPEAAIRTAFILGYPGENEIHFEQLLRFVEWAKFDKIGVFPYSPENGTKAATLRPRPRNNTSQRRCEILMALQREISRSIQESKIGTTKEIIIDGLSDNHDFTFIGRTEQDAPEVDGRVFFINNINNSSSFINATIIDTNDYDLFAKF